ncbi:MAG TPA: hypothetical protein PLV92_27150, partial [Pirellulaceae bacterium]|nr:hypothetical protein [Pirellulaceae bacterium]
VWRRFLPDVRRIIGVVDGRAIVVTDAGVLAVAMDTGATVWRTPLPELMVAQACAGPHGIMVSQSIPIEAGKKFRPQLVWLDPADGHIVNSAPLPQFDDVEPRLGPLVIQSDRVWTWFGRGPHEPKRELVELKSK